VLVGENNSGKSNIVDALRLVLTPLGTRRSRYSEVTDLSFGREGETVQAVATFDQLTAVQRGHYVTALNVADMTAIYTTRFTVDLERPTRSRPVTTVGPGDGPEAEPAKRAELCHVYLEPLRDAQRELDSSSSRRLATIIEYLHGAGDVTEFLQTANNELRKVESHPVLTTTQAAISTHLTDLTEPVRLQKMGVQFTDYKLHRLATALRLKLAETGMDLADLADSGLGYANLLYVATVLLQLHNAKDAELTVLLVEEPEAHLHPQMQAVFLQYLREQAQASAGDDTTGPAGRIQVVVTTHSPIIASGIPVENVVVLRSQRIGDAQQGEAASQPAQRTATAAVPVAKLGLSATDARKLGQYLDATKAALQDESCPEEVHSLGRTMARSPR
jgi:putative ATP-dependent endonuclease of the OLD family